MTSDEMPRFPIRNAILIAGPTASGKSAMALELAAERNGVIVNADSMQIYDVLRIITARPHDADLAAAPHHLYGHVAPAAAYSVAAWLADVRCLANSGVFDGKTPIFVGGTGLYFSALTQGLSDIPQIPDAVRSKLRTQQVEDGAATLYRRLQQLDPEMAARLNPDDGQRIVRALEVFETTGKSLSHWQQQRSPGLVDLAGAQAYVLEPPRPVLHERIARRFLSMVESGAIDEVKSVLELRLEPSLPVMKAIGVREFSAFLGGDINQSEAIERAIAATRQYAKRQSTWFRNQFGPEWTRIETPQP